MVFKLSFEYYENCFYVIFLADKKTKEDFEHAIIYSLKKLVNIFNIDYSDPICLTSIFEQDDKPYPIYKKYFINKMKEKGFQYIKPQINVDFEPLDGIFSDKDGDLCIETISRFEKCKIYKKIDKVYKSNENDYEKPILIYKKT